MNETIKIRIPVVISPEGSYCATAYGGPRGHDERDEPAMIELSKRYLDTMEPGRAQVRWIEAEIPVHSEPVAMGVCHD